MSANHLLGCPACGCTVFFEIDDEPQDRVRCGDCDWRGTAAELRVPKRTKGTPRLVSIVVPAHLEQAE